MSRAKKKRKAELLANYFKIKKETFYFGKIRRYFSGSDKAGLHQVISDKTYQDLDLDEVFMYADRTSSRVGQQYLYHILRTIPEGKKRCERFEHLIKVFKENKELKEDILVQLDRLNKDEAYYVTSLFQEEYMAKPSWFWIIQLLALINISSALLSIFYPQFLIVILCVLFVNYFIHVWNKTNLFQYSGAILQMLVLNQVAKEIVKTGKLVDNKEKINKAINTIDSLGFKMSVFKMEAKLQSEIGQGVELIAEILKAMFLIEPLILFNVLKELDAKREEIHQVYKLVGEIDVAISISSFRKGLPYYAHPTITAKKKQISATDLYHPLLVDFVSNSIELQEKSVLLTGSNMSGKTTFIRTLGINVIVSQTINTCCAREFVMAPLKVHSAIRISDDIMSEKSYYFEEVLSIRKMVEESRSGAHNLFLLDELFKGTNTVERIAAGKSVLTYLNQGDNIVFISTHDLELADYLKETYDLYHFTELVENESILFDYKIKAGNLKTTNAIRILELNKYPHEIITEARELSEQLNKMKEVAPELKL